MNDYPLIIIGGGLSGLAAGIRFARFGQKVLILEKHNKAGGLNSYYHRNGQLLESGLHAVTNYADPDRRHTPLNLLLRQLKLSRRRLTFHQQIGSEILFPGLASLFFTNDINLLKENIAGTFPGSADAFTRLVNEIGNLDPFQPKPWQSTRAYLRERLPDPLLQEMLLCPLMYYGGFEENDLDLSHFVIMFRSIFMEGFWRPAGTIKDFLDILLEHYQSLGGEIRFRCGVSTILTDPKKSSQVIGVRLDTGKEITCDTLLSTIGYPLETLSLVPAPAPASPTENQPHKPGNRLSFMESIFSLPGDTASPAATTRTIIFFNLGEKFNYRKPEEALDTQSGVICFPNNFAGFPRQESHIMRVTHLANYHIWRQADRQSKNYYNRLKAEWCDRSKQAVGKIIGNSDENIVYQDAFTPVTIERFTAKAEGAVYGNPTKTTDGRTPFTNLFVAGTDHGYIGIVGSMMSGVVVVNNCIL